MNENLVNVILKLKEDSSYVLLFKKAYHDSIINSERLLKSLAQFTGLMISSNSRYDKFRNGLDTFSATEKTDLNYSVQNARTVIRNLCSLIIALEITA